MTNAPFRNIALPLVIISALLFGLGVAAAWNVQRQQVTTSEVVAREVRSIVVMQELYIAMREIRRLLDLFLRTEDPTHLDRIPEFSAITRRSLALAADLASSPDERAQVEVVATGYHHFQTALDQVLADTSGAFANDELEHLNDQVLTHEVLSPAERCLKFNQQVVDRTNRANRRTTDQLREGFLLLGVAGGGAGVIAGIVIARSLQRSILELQISMHDATGRLRQVVDPISVNALGSNPSWRAALGEFEQQVTQVLKMLQQREHEVLRNEQLAAMGQLAAGMAHELRNPLMPIKMLVQSALQKEQMLGGRPLQIVADEITRLEQTIQEFLEFARPPHLEPTEFDLRLAIEQTVALVVARAARQHVEITTRLPDTRCAIMADQSQIRQVLLNLVLNSLDELDAGGRIEVFLEPLVAPSGTTSPAQRWQLKLSDTGPGLSADMQPRIFEPFVSGKETGTGLGLTICKRIVEAHGGTIAAGNRPQGGACFTIQLPA